MAKGRKSTRTTAQKPIEQYEHKDKQRVNNPPVGLVDAHTDNGGSKKKAYQYDPHLDPQLQWAGKAEHTSFEVPTVSLHVHERIDPHRIISTVKMSPAGGGAGGGRQLSLFEEHKKPLREAIEFYKHKENWSNRLIAGDSLLVMNSLLEKEGMGGKVQMVYFDPPYGIKYGSNFQPFVNKRDVKDGKDEDLTAEPEMIKAFRDTWELGIHSYLTYLRDRLLLARELLHESGSVFVQISDENVHHVREIMDEVFGRENFVRLIFFRTTSGLGQKYIDKCGDYIIWYTKKNGELKFRSLFIEKDFEKEGVSGYNKIIHENGEIQTIPEYEKLKKKTFRLSDLPQKSKLFSATDLKSQSGFGGDIIIDGKAFRTETGSWKTNQEGINCLLKAGRIIVTGATPRYLRYHDDFSYIKLDNMWGGQLSEQNKDYVVQTSVEVIKRCMLMSTDPGDLVLDITCGSGTTAFVAENWGRRWITCDTSRVAITLAKQRLMTANFDYFQLAYPEEGVGSGFKYKTVPHITLKSIANNEPAPQETLYDQPSIDNKKTRVTGPFTVEAVPAPTVISGQQLVDSEPIVVSGQEVVDSKSPSLTTSNQPLTTTSIARTGETLRQDEWRNELLRAGVRAKGGYVMKFTRLEPLSGTRFLQADGELVDSGQSVDSGQGVVDSKSPSLTTSNQPLTTTKKVVVCFGPEHAPLEQRTVELALEEARTLKPKPEIILFCAFQFDPEARKDIDETNWPGMTLLEAQMNADLLTDDLKKKRSSNESFWLIGQPDVQIVDSGQWLVDSNSNKRILTNYECVKKFSGLDSVAKIQSLSREDLCFYLALSEGRDLWYDLANEAGCGVSPVEHSRRAGQEQHGGIQTIFGYSQRLDGGIGDLDRIIVGFESAKKGGFRGFVEGLRGNPKVTQWLAQISNKITNHYQLTTNHYAQMEVNGFDYYNPKTGTVESGGKGDIAMWMLDHDYDGRSLFPSQVFFPMAGAKEGWATLAKNLRAEIDEEKIEAFRGTISLPFKAGKQVAVKIIDARGIESLKIIRL